MNIIIILKNDNFTNYITNHLSEISEKDSVLFFYSYRVAEDFITNNIIKNNLELDLIITEDNIEGMKATDFYNSIIKDMSRTYSNSDFNFYCIPVILIADKGDHISIFSKYKFSDVIESIDIAKFNSHISKFISAVREWRRNTLDELDNLGIKFNSGQIDYTYYFSSNKRLNLETNILSENFRLIPRKLYYAWLTSNERQIELAINAYITQLKIATRTDNKKKEEKEFHKIFNANDFLIKRDNYSKHWYEAKMRYGKGNFFEPDYSLKPNFSQKTDLSILEVKLPSEGFIKKTKFHPSPYSSLMNHIFQVNDYKEYIESDEYNSKLKKLFGFIPSNVEYNLLIGRQSAKDDNLEMLSRRMRQMDALHINLLTYDELLEYQVRYLDRMKILNIL